MPIVCTIGFFDGVHRGHLCLIQQVKDEARRRGWRSLIITFDRHPQSVFAPDRAPRLLTSMEEKMAILRATGIDDIFVLPFDREMAALTAREFMTEVLKGQLGVGALVIGYDHRFGRRTPALPSHDAATATTKEGFEQYRAYGRELGIDVVLAHEFEGEHVSSSAIRRALEEGDVTKATHLLGRPYTWTGRVVHGHAIGRHLGFPTANLETTEPTKLLPANGAYAVEVTEASGKESPKWQGMLNIGQRPTLDNGTDTSIEAHLFNFDGDLYGRTLTLTFASRLRAERRFDSEEALATQLQRDKLLAESLFR